MSADRVPPARTATPPEPIVYLRRPGILVTSRQILVGPYRYQVCQLADLMRARGSTHPGALVGLVIAAAEVPLVALLIGLVNAPAAWLFAPPALLIPCLVGLVCLRRWPAPYELLARYRGGEVILFATRDQLEFGQVARAVRRAVEATPGGDTRP
ncbi:hypothetical protein GCM10023322_60040 [Rugosimonospora acidiphila]|uniref:Uncharacterized protein n=1 Tax=Rugosimonospora acidiphila TaxID=556531 RepID=A0ABP9SHD4_9ACTN